MKVSLAEQVIRNGYDLNLLREISIELIEQIIKAGPLPEEGEPRQYVQIGCMAAICKFLSEINIEKLTEIAQDETIEPMRPEQCH